jgi:hypothetical protein
MNKNFDIMLYLIEKDNSGSGFVASAGMFSVSWIIFQREGKCSCMHEKHSILI